MDNDLEQSGERPESRKRREDKLKSIRDTTAAIIKDHDDKYVKRLGILADLLNDLNTTGERLIELAIEIRDRLQPPAK